MVSIVLVYENWTVLVEPYICIYVTLLTFSVVVIPALACDMMLLVTGVYVDANVSADIDIYIVMIILIWLSCCNDIGYNPKDTGIHLILNMAALITNLSIDAMIMNQSAVQALISTGYFNLILLTSCPIYFVSEITQLRWILLSVLNKWRLYLPWSSFLSYHLFNFAKQFSSDMILIWRFLCIVLSFLLNWRPNKQLQIWHSQSFLITSVSQVAFTKSTNDKKANSSSGFYS